MRFTKNIIMIFLVCSFYSCSRLPSQNDCLKVAHNLVNKLSGYKKDSVRFSDYIKIISVIKNNSINKSTKNGQEYSVVETTVQIEILKECYWQQSFGFTIWTPSEYLSSGFKSKNEELIKPGSTLQFNKNFYFYKTENGWRGEDDKIY